MSALRDTLYATLASEIEAFRFDERVTAIFADMIRRSVPGYASVIAMTGVLGAQIIQPDSRVYDLGCSLGTTLLTVYDRVNVPCELVGIDSSEAMIEACRQNLAVLTDKPQVKTKLHCEDVLNSKLQNASLVIMNYTLQFIPQSSRLTLLEKVHTGMKPGGALVLSEKLAFDDALTSTTLGKLYDDFKYYNGYTELEISQKRQALENVLIPDTEQTHIDRLSSAGFSQPMRWFQCLNFASFVAYKY